MAGKDKAGLARGREILKVPMQSNNAGAGTVKGYLMKLLQALWLESDGFSGKHPFGDSDWEYELYIALGQANVIEMSFDEDGFVDDIPAAQRHEADRLIGLAIRAL